jgi:hypothetical protein
MTRCNSCNGLVTKNDVECFVCGEPIPGARKRGKQRVKAVPVAHLAQAPSMEPPAKPIARVSNLLFLGSLVLTALSFLSDQKLPVAVCLALSVILLSMRLFDGRIASKDSSPGLN